MPGTAGPLLTPGRSTITALTPAEPARHAGPLCEQAAQDRAGRGCDRTARGPVAGLLVRLTQESEVGVIRAAPTPCAMRAATRTPSEGAKTQAAGATAKTAMPRP